MILPMKCMALLCLDHDRDKVMDRLQSLGVLHVQLESKPDNTHIAYKQRCLQDVERAINVLNIAAKNLPTQYDLPPFESKPFLSATINEIEHLDALQIRYDNLCKDVQNLLPWGNFDPKNIRELEKKGVYVYLCTSTPDRLVSFNDDVTVVEVKRTKRQVWYMVASLSPLPIDTLPLAPLPEMLTLSEAQNLLIETEGKISQSKYQLGVLSKQRHLLAPLKLRFEDELSYHVNRAAMSASDDGKFLWIKGYVPEQEMEHIRTFANENACAVMFSDPTDEEMPPTELKTTTVVGIIKPLLSFIGITPGYREWDVSPCVLIFFTIFVAMITNDAGYGIIFFLGSLIAWLAVRNNKSLYPLMGFLTLQGAACVVWGVAMGSYFGLQEATLNNLGLSSLVQLAECTKFKLPWLGTAYDGKDIRGVNIEYGCFVLAYVHLSFAHLWKTKLALQSKQFKEAIVNLGWILFMLGNMMLAAQFVIGAPSPDWILYPFAIGVPLILLGVNYKDIGSIFQAPLNLINGFVDTLSYIRLYAVGLAGACIASNFNIILGDLATNPVMTIISGSLLTAGHVLNILLVLMAILVHAIRLNALEFSNHMGLEWSGYPYAPFSRKNKESALAHKQS